MGAKGGGGEYTRINNLQSKLAEARYDFNDFIPRTKYEDKEGKRKMEIERCLEG